MFSYISDGFASLSTPKDQFFPQGVSMMSVWLVSRLLRYYTCRLKQKKAFCMLLTVMLCMEKS